MVLAPSRARRPGACGAEACVKGPGASSSCMHDALLVAPPFPWLRPSISRICVGPRDRDTLMAEAAEEFHFSPRPNRAAEVNWHTWSKDAFDEARTTGKPILLSISAVWCHWCHVMDETTYSHPSVIDLINREYVPVRVDNDVRPDINQRYNMGGWPTTAFLTASGDILTGATYLPPDQMAGALVRIADYYRESQAEIASRVLEARKRAASGVARSAGELDPGLVDLILDAVTSAYDADYGGFGGSPKFPP